MAMPNATPATAIPSTNRWLQIVLGVICMVAAANIQYAWTLFVPEIQKTFGWDRASIQVAFTLFVLFETWLVPIEGWFVDKYGPGFVIFVGGILCGIGWVMNSYATTLTSFYAAQVIAGIGAGGVYGTCIGSALRWFPDKRGLAAGITAAGFGAGRGASFGCGSAAWAGAASAASAGACCRMTNWWPTVRSAPRCWSCWPAACAP